MPSLILTTDDAYSRLSVKALGATAPVPLAEEKRLCALIETGRKATQQLRRAKGLPPAARQQLAAQDFGELSRAVKAGQQARAQLIQANGRLVISIAARYSRRGYPLNELAQEGMLGLIRGVDKFDLSRGFKLSTYATWWIRQSISRYVAQHSRTIHLPVYQVDNLYRLRQATAQLAQELGREPTLEEVAARMNQEPDKLRWLLANSQSVISLDNPMLADDNDSPTLGESVADEDSLDPEHAAAAALVRERIHRAIEQRLTARQAQIISLRFGLNDGHPHKLESIAGRFGLTRERIRQIEQQSLAILRQDPELVRLLLGLTQQAAVEEAQVAA